MSQGVPATDPLRAFLSGKRQYERYPYPTTVELGGLRGQFRARMVDLSLGGALLALSQSALDLVKLPGEDSFQIVAREFAEGFDIRFLEAGVAVEAIPVRLCIPPGEEEVLYLGCRFTELLSPTLRARLGVPDPRGA